MIFDDNPENDDCRLCGNCIFWLPCSRDPFFGICIGYRDHIYTRRSFSLCPRFIHCGICTKSLAEAHYTIGCFMLSDYIKGGNMPELKKKKV